ncbi:MAG: repair protein RadC [Pseudomonadota bacterium]
MNSTATSRPQLRERLLCAGPEVLSDAQLLALLLGSGTPRASVDELAHRLLSLAGSAAGLHHIRGLAPEVTGVGPAKIARLFAGLELGRRSLASGVPLEIHCEQDVARWARGRLIELEHEEVWLLSLDARNRLRATTRVAQGGSHGCALTPQDVLRPAVRNGAAAIILVHNHPSGDPTPSRDDLAMTERVAKAGELLGIPVLDHIVVARDGARSIGRVLGW